jgi:hypothetical protein
MRKKIETAIIDAAILAGVVFIIWLAVYLHYNFG